MTTTGCFVHNLYYLFLIIILWLYPKHFLRRNGQVGLDLFEGRSTGRGVTPTHLHQQLKPVRTGARDGKM